MAVICLASLKGGVGKTSLGVNLARATAESGAHTLLMDMDPSCYASRFFNEQCGSYAHIEERLAELLLGARTQDNAARSEKLLEIAFAAARTLTVHPRQDLSIMTAEPLLRQFQTLLGSKAFKVFLGRFIRELCKDFCYIVLDTPPALNTLTKTVLAAADLVLVPLDASAMSIEGLEELARRCTNLTRPSWAIVRTMVNRQASRVRTLAEDRLREHLPISSTLGSDDVAIEDYDEFVSLVAQFESQQDGQESQSHKPLYLLDSVIYRTEQQNRLSFTKTTAFDDPSSRHLAAQYRAVSREVQRLLECLAKESRNTEVSPANGVQEAA